MIGSICKKKHFKKINLYKHYFFQILVEDEADKKLLEILKKPTGANQHFAQFVAAQLDNMDEDTAAEAQAAITQTLLQFQKS